MISLTHTEFNIIANEVKELFGIYYHENKIKDFERILKQIYIDYNFSSISEFKKNLLNRWLSSQIKNNIAEYFTIGETYFFRESTTFNALKYNIIPELINKNKALKIWSVSCSSGEEPYSIAIYLKEFFNGEIFSNAEIYGTDLSEAKIHKARVGRYGNWSFRNCSSYMKNKYFKHEGNRSKINDEIKHKVKFSILNLVEDDYEEPFSLKENFDLILFRNTMIYFDQETIDEIINKLSISLKTDGYLITGLSEISLVRSSSLTKMDIAGGRYFIKRESKQIAATKIKEEINHEEIDNILTLFERKKNFIKKTEDEDSLELIFNYDTLKSNFEKGNYEYVIHNISKILSEKSINIFSSDKSREIFYIYCKSLANTGKIQEAMELGLNFISVYKLYPEFYLLLYRLSLESNDLESALKYIQAAYFLDNENIMINFSMALINSKLGNENLSKKNLKTTLKLLDNKKEDEIIENSDGMSVGNLKDIISSMLGNSDE